MAFSSLNDGYSPLNAVTAALPLNDGDSKSGFVVCSLVVSENISMISGLSVAKLFF